MAKIYYDPDNDELIPISKSKSARSKVSSADADDISERLERIESELQALNRKQMRHLSRGITRAVLVTDITRDIRITAARHQIRLLLLLGRMPGGN